LKSNQTWRFLAVIDHKFDKDKVVSVIGKVTENLKLKDIGIVNGKRKGKMLIFSKNWSR
jgi:hypothetical protein